MLKNNPLNISIPINVNCMILLLNEIHLYFILYSLNLFYRWVQHKDGWIGVFSKTVWKLRQNEEYLEYQVIGSLLETPKSSKNGNTDTFFRKLLENYFRLDLNLTDYYKEWSAKDELFRSVCQQFYGIRMLRQEPVENLFSFICSQNNHISR